MNLWETSGKGLCLKDNPLEIPAIDILKQGMDAVKKYFSMLYEL
jgi:hypothetical protein